MGSMTATGPVMTSQVNDCGNVMEPHRVIAACRRKRLLLWFVSLDPANLRGVDV